MAAHPLGIAVHVLDTSRLLPRACRASGNGTDLAMSAGMMSPLTLAYRDATEGARLRYADLLERTREGTALDAVRDVLAARTGRICAGLTGIVGAVLMALAALGGRGGLFRPALFEVPPSAFLFLSWPAMGAAYAIGSFAARRRVDRLATPPGTHDIHAAVAWLERARPVPALRWQAAGYERQSVALPLIAYALLTPLTLHSPVCLATGGLGALDSWIRVSLVIVGHAHLVLAFLYWWAARWVSNSPTQAIVFERSRKEWSIFGFTVLASALPGAVLFLIPPILTTVTALLFHPLFFRAMIRTLRAERRALS